MTARRLACFFIIALLGSSTAQQVSATTNRIPAELEAPSSRTVPVVSRIATRDPVVFITIDDGFTRTDRAKALLNEIEYSAFVLRGPLEQAPGFWKQEYARGVSYGNHTARHPNLKRMSKREQRREICAGRDAVKKVVGTTPVLFRPPGGNWNRDTLLAARDCSMTHLVLWNVVVSGSSISTWGPPISRGDIILLHFRPDLDVSLKVLMKELERLNLRPADIADYLGPSRPVLSPR
jgi:peptidoglycan/xylan/chitin deacetylase (PgdA/CDA1 family)